jgi:hypothetical protein
MNGHGQGVLGTALSTSYLSLHTKLSKWPMSIKFEFMEKVYPEARFSILVKTTLFRYSSIQLNPRVLRWIMLSTKMRDRTVRSTGPGAERSALVVRTVRACAKPIRVSSFLV